MAPRSSLTRGAGPLKIEFKKNWDQVKALELAAVMTLELFGAFILLSSMMAASPTPGAAEILKTDAQECEDVCLNTHCVGFTRADGNNCWMYANVASFETDPTVTFYLLNSSLP